MPRQLTPGFRRDPWPTAIGSAGKCKKLLCVLGFGFGLGLCARHPRTALEFSYRVTQTALADPHHTEQQQADFMDVHSGSTRQHALVVQSSIWKFLGFLNHGRGKPKVPEEVKCIHVYSIETAHRHSNKSKWFQLGET